MRPSLRQSTSLWLWTPATASRCLEDDAAGATVTQQRQSQQWPHCARPGAGTQNGRWQTDGNTPPPPCRATRPELDVRVSSLVPLTTCCVTLGRQLGLSVPFLCTWGPKTSTDHGALCL